MAKLPGIYSDSPDQTALGVVQMEGGGAAQLATPDVSSGLSEVGRRISKEGDALTSQDDLLQKANAKAQVIATQVQAVNKLQTDPYSPTATQDYLDTVQSAANNASMNIGSPKSRSVFLAEQNLSNQQSMEMVNNINRGKWRDAQGATLTNNLDTMQKNYSVTQDPALRTQILQNMNDLITTNADSGVIDQEKAVQIRKSTMENTAKSFIMSQPPSDQIRLLKQVQPLQSSDQSSIIDYVIDNHEGGYLANDAGHGPTNFGINQQANAPSLQALGVADVKNMTRDQAVQIYKDQYWNKMGIDKLPDNMKAIAFDTAVNFGVPRAQQMLAQAGNDPQKLAQLRDDFHQKLVTDNPDTYGQYKSSWQQRDQNMADIAGGQIPRNGTIADALPVPERQQLLRSAQAEYGRQMVDQGHQELMAATNSAQLEQVVNNPTYGDVFDKLAPAADKIEKMNQKDPMGMSINRNEVQPIDWNNQQTLPQQLVGRSIQAQTNSQNWGTNPMLLSDSEAKGLTDYISKQPLNNQMQYLSSIATSLSNDPKSYASIIGQIRPHSPATAAAGLLTTIPDTSKQTLSSSWGNDVTISGTRAAETLLNGEKYLNTLKDTTGEGVKAKWKLPSDQDFLNSIGSTYGNLFANNPDGLNNAVETAKAYYVGKSIEAGDVAGKESPDSNDRLAEALRVAIGTPVQIHDETVTAPWGMNESQFMDGLHQSTKNAIKLAGGKAPDSVNALSYSNTPVPGTYYVKNGGTFYTVNGVPLKVSLGMQNASAIQ